MIDPTRPAPRRSIAESRATAPIWTAIGTGSPASLIAVDRPAARKRYRQTPAPATPPRVTETEFIAALRMLPLHPGARGLMDDAATLATGGGTLVLTTDTLVEGVHYRPDDPPRDVAWKLVATNLSDLAAKGAVPVGVLLNYPLRASRLCPSPARTDAGHDAWDTLFLDGLAQALARFATPILGGDTVSLPANAPRVLTLTAIGEAATAPDRRGARAGDQLYVTGSIGAALLGFEHPETEPNAYRRPTPRIADGIALARHVTAMMDVSDGLLLDAARMAHASDLAVEIALDAVPVPPELAHDRLRACRWGDDYQLLFALPPTTVPPVPAARIGRFAAGSGLRLSENGVSVPLPATLGYLHSG